jgi:hypothetical protein
MAGSRTQGPIRFDGDLEIVGSLWDVHKIITFVAVSKEKPIILECPQFLIFSPSFAD